MLARFFRRFWPARRDHRDIFRYWDGSRFRLVDPMVVFRGLREDKDLVLEEHPIAAIKEDLEAFDICVRAARHVFGLESLSDGKRLSGVTDHEAFGVLLAFGAYLEALKKHQFDADLAASHGIGILGPLDHAAKCGLWLNSSRIAKRRAETFLVVVEAFKGGGPPPDWYEAMTETNEEAAAAYNRSRVFSPGQG